MKYLKLYEGFFDFLKKKKENIIDRYSKEEISNMFLEIADDLNLNYNRLLHTACISRRQIKGSLGFKDFLYNNLWWIAVPVGHIDIHGKDPNDNCYVLTIPKFEMSNLSYIVDTLKSKKYVYNFKFVLEMTPNYTLYIYIY